MAKIIYNIRIILYLISLIFIFLISPTLIDSGLIGIIFLISQIMLSILNVYEYLKNKKNDISYNILHINIYIYIIILYFKLSEISLPIDTIKNYLTINLTSLSLLSLFVMIYSTKVKKTRKIFF